MRSSQESGSKALVEAVTLVLCLLLFGILRTLTKLFLRLQLFFLMVYTYSRTGSEMLLS